MRLKILLLFILLGFIILIPAYGQNNESWTSIEVIGYEEGLTFSHPVLIDFNLDISPDPTDGIYDIISGRDQGTLQYQFNDGNNTNFDLLASESAIFSIQYSRSAPFVYDINGDNRDDLLVGDENGEIDLYINEETNFVLNNTLIQGIEVEEFAKPTVADLDNDGLVEIIVAENSNLVLFENTGTTDQPNWIENRNLFANFLLGEHLAPFPIDPNDDGYPDLVIGTADNGLAMLRNLGSEETEIIEFEIISSVERNNPFRDIDIEDSTFLTPSLIDLNNDGMLDLIFGSENGEIHIFENKGVDLTNLSLGLNLSIIIPIFLFLLIWVGVGVYYFTKRLSPRGKPIYLMVLHSIGLAPYKFEFSADMVQDINLAGGAFSGIQSIIAEVTSSDLNLLEAGENKILIARQPFPSNDSEVQVILWATEDDPRLRKGAEKLAYYIAHTYEENFERGTFDRDFEIDINKKVEEIFSNFL